MDITQKQLMDKMVSQTNESMQRNLSHHTKHTKNSKENREIQFACEWPIFCAISCLLSNTRMPQSRSQFWLLAETNSSEFYCFEAKLFSPSFPKGKRGTIELFPIICQSVPYLMYIVTQQPLGWFTPNQVYCDCLRLHMHNIRVTCPSGVVHWLKHRVLHLADT